MSRVGKPIETGHSGQSHDIMLCDYSSSRSMEMGLEELRHRTEEYWHLNWSRKRPFLHRNFIYQKSIQIPDKNAAIMSQNRLHFIKGLLEYNGQKATLEIKHNPGQEGVIWMEQI